MPYNCALFQASLLILFQYLSGQDILDDIRRRLSEAAVNIEPEPPNINPELPNIEPELPNIEPELPNTGNTEPEVTYFENDVELSNVPTDYENYVESSNVPNVPGLVFEVPCATSTPIQQNTPCQSFTR